MDDIIDLAIIGGGPAGSSAAYHAVRRGLKRVVILDRAPHGRLKSCAGGISSRAEAHLRQAGLWSRIEPETYSITSARMLTASGTEMVLAGSGSATVLHRALLDASLLEAAVAAGAVAHHGCQVTAIEPTDASGRAPVRVDYIERSPANPPKNRSLLARAAIVAAGATTRLHRDPRPRTHITTCTAWYRGVDIAPNRLEMIFDARLAPHYLWLFPESDDTVNIGLCVGIHRLKESGMTIGALYQELLERYFGGRMSGAQRFVEPMVHPIMPADRVEHHAIPHTFLAGDACRLINAFTGEGISFALRSGQLAVQAVLIHRHRPWKQAAAWYQFALRSEMRLELAIGNQLCRLAPPLLRAGAAMWGFGPVRQVTTALLSKL